MKKIFFLLFIFLNFSNSIANEFKLEKVLDKFKKPWSLSFIDESNLLLTEKSGNLYHYNLNKKK